MKMDNETRKAFQTACRGWAEEYGVRDGIRPELLCLCLEVPEEGVNVIHHSFNGLLLPLVHYEKNEVIGKYCLGRYNVRNGVLMFVNNDGRTFLTCDRAVLGALQQAGYLRDESLPVCLPNEEVMMGNSDLWRQWRNIVTTQTL